MQLSVIEKDALIVGIDTCLVPGGVSVFQGTSLIAELVLDSKLSHSITLLSEIDRLLANVQKQVSDVDVFVVATGPGSFTGLRIGIATVLGFVAALGIQSVGVPTLKALAFSSGRSDATLAMIPAGRGELFAQLFKVGNGSEVEELSEAWHLPPGRLLDRLGDRRALRFAGRGAIENLELIHERAKNAGVSISKSNETSDWSVCAGPATLSTAVGMLGIKAWQQGSPSGISSLVPNYVRPSDPELKDLCQ